MNLRTLKTMRQKIMNIIVSPTAISDELSMTKDSICQPNKINNTMPNFFIN